MSMVEIPVEPPITEYLHQKASALRIPLSGSFELTPVCNMACKMCYVRMTKQQQEAIHPLRTAEEWLALGREAKEHGMLYLLLTGGEPFMRPDFREILSGLHKMGFLITLNSNATLIDEAKLEWLKETPPMRVNVTLYGASDATYERLCGNPRGFSQVTKAISLLREAGIMVKINCSLTPYNACDLEDMIAFCRKENLIIQPTSYMFPPLRRDSSMIGRNDRFTPEEAAYYAAKAEALMNGEEAFLKRAEENRFDGLPTDSGDDCLETEGETIRCRAGKCSFWVTWDGRLLPCGMLPGEGVESVFDIGFEAAWKQATETSAAIRLPARCRSCPLRDQCRSCAAMVYTESGNFSTVPDYRCKMAYAYPKACRTVAEEIRKKGCKENETENQKEK